MLRRSQPPLTNHSLPLVTHTGSATPADGPQAWPFPDEQINDPDDFSKETSEHRKAFLALRPRLRHLEVKFKLFTPAKVWITKNNVSKDFDDPEDLRLLLNSLQTLPMNTATRLQPQSLSMVTAIQSPQEPSQRDQNDTPRTFHPTEET
ncbi:hypothetical protein NDU88_001876 [Pleurodeles waltl]|uniref:Uncharacterized protein n=1 Tax=Pleurodeles waltl TaxID=8319 RepID=A0AAV7SDD5_PLEWA|nr:hypothetical protein NDU88_001876 [Pleurodeles waltl]